MPSGRRCLVPMRRSIYWCCAFGLACALSGCASFPRIDPSGERIFLPAGAPSPDSPGLTTWGVSINPSQVVAPVGSEVVLVASLCGPEGFMVTNQRLEWMIAPNGVGQFLSPGERRAYELIQLLRGVPRKLDGQYTVNTTLVVPRTLDRGTPTPADDIVVQDGQAWVSVGSPTEGTSHITVYAPTVYGWDRRQQTATIYWVDAQWRFPQPAIAAAGGRQTLTTFVGRQSDNTPLAGWMVRYEVAGGPAAGFAPDGSRVVEVATNEAGEATVEIEQTDSSPGTNPIKIQVIRPAGQVGQTRSVPVGSGATLITWTGAGAAPSTIGNTPPSLAPANPVSPPTSPPSLGRPGLNLTVRTTGPAEVAVGNTATYRIEINNAGDQPARNVTVSDYVPREVVFVNSDPAGEAAGFGQRWLLDEIGPRSTRTIEANYRVTVAGTFQYCANVNLPNGSLARDCVTTRATPPPLEVVATGPLTAAVGSEVRFEVTVVNRTDRAVTNLVVTDRFDRGLEHAAAASAIERDLGDLMPGQATRFAVVFRVAQAGELCQEISVQGAGGIQAETRKCLTAVGSAIPRGLEPDDRATPLPGGSRAAGAKATVSVRNASSSRPSVQDTVTMEIDVTNTSNETLESLKIANQFDSSLEPEQATDGANWEGTALAWKLDRLSPGRTARREIVFKCVRSASRACNRVTLTASGMEGVSQDACVQIVGQNEQPDRSTPEQPPATGTLRVSVNDTSDPIRVGEETLLQVVLENQGPSQFDVVLVLTYDDQMRFLGASGPERASVSSGRIQFLPIRELRNGESVSFEVRMQGMRAGSARVQAEVATRGSARAARGDQTTEVLP